VLAGRLQQFGRIGEVATELGGEAELGIFRRDAQAHEQAQVVCAGAVGMRGRLDDLLQFLDRVEAEGLHAVFEVRFADRARSLDRVHEAQLGLRERLAHEPHLCDGGDVEMADPVIPQDLQELGRGVGLHRIQRLARKLLDEETGCARRGVRAVENDRFVRREGANYRPCVRMMVQLKGPPNGKFERGSLAV